MSVSAASLSARISASRAAAASKPQRSAAAKGSSDAAAASDAAASLSSRYAASAAESLCSLCARAAYALSHNWSSARGSPPRARTARRISGASAATRARSLRAHSATSARDMARSGAHSRVHVRTSTPPAVSWRAGRLAGATGPLAANTTCLSSSCTRLSRYARRSLSVVAAARIRFSRCATSRRTADAARRRAASSTGWPSSERSVSEHRAMTCSR